MNIYTLDDDFKVNSKLNDFFNNKKAFKDNYCVSIGVFDGIHRGHIKVIKKVIDYSDNLSCSSAIFTFDKNPKDIFYKEHQKEIISNDEKYQKFKELGIKNVFEIIFTQKVKNTSGRDFIDKLLTNFNIKKIIVGSDWKVGSFNDSLCALDAKRILGDKIEIVDDEIIEGERISSTKIRKEIQKDGGMSERIFEKYFKICQD